MKKTFLVAIMACIWLSAPAWAQDVPHDLAGFTLGDSIAAHKDKIEPDTMLPLRYLECVKQVQTKPRRGYKTGLVDYGTCGGGDAILRIKMKYVDQSRDFFDTLLKRFIKRFGEPDKYRGDPFHVMISWKWAFTDKKGHKISMVLAHNLLDEEEKIGNSVKLTDWTLLEGQRVCYGKTHPQEPVETFKPSKADWNLLVPE